MVQGPICPKTADVVWKGQRAPIARGVDQRHCFVMSDLKQLTVTDISIHEARANTAVGFRCRISASICRPELFAEFTDGIAIARVAVGFSPLHLRESAFERLTGYELHEAIGRDCRYLQVTIRDQPQIALIRTACA